MVAVAITRMELDAAGLRRAAARERDAAASRRMRALALVLEGRPRGEAARLAGMDRQTLRDWVHRYNAAGLPALREGRARNGKAVAAVGGPTRGVGGGCPPRPRPGHRRRGALAPL
jgi:hypothetical protein